MTETRRFALSWRAFRGRHGGVSPLLLGLFVLCLGLGLPGGAAWADGGDQKGEELEDQRVDYVPFRTESGWGGVIREVAVDVGGERFLSRSRRGVERSYENRLDYRAVPYVGMLSSRHVAKGDFTPESQVGTAWMVGDVLHVKTEGLPPMVRFSTVRIVNEDWMFRFLAGPVAGGAARDLPGGARQVGTAHAGEAGELTVLIRPSVVTHSVF